VAENQSERTALLEHTSGIVAAYVAKNAIPGSDLPNVLRTVYGKLADLGKPPVKPEPERAPAVPINRSVRPEFVVCLECGKKQKMLKRHLATAHGLTTDAYRALWGLAYDYPIVAPNYAEVRRTMAKKFGLGRKAAEPAKPSPRRRNTS